MHDKEDNKSNGESPRALQTTPLTRDRALAVQPKQEERGRGILRFLPVQVDLLDTTNKRCLLRINKTRRSESQTLIHIFNIQERMVRVVGMVATPFRTQTITPNMNTRTTEPPHGNEIEGCSRLGS